MTSFSDPATEKLIWVMLERLATSPDEGRAQFTGTLAQRNVLWREQRNFIRQGRTYWDAAKATRGSAAALNYYYSMLNLAKAELLRITPTPNLVNVRHGLKSRHSASRKFSSEQVEVDSGVFPMLVEHRTGIRPRNGTRWPVSRLLRQVPEIGLEVATTGFGIPKGFTGYHAIVQDDQSAWPIVCFAQNLGPWEDSPVREPIIRLLETQFERVDLATFRDWRQVFAVSVRYSPGSVVLYQAKRTFSQGGAPDQMSASLLLGDLLGGNISDPVADPADFIVSMSLYKSRRVDMPAPLARYALMFWLSSVVRYRPSVLDPRDLPDQGWVADAIAADTGLALLAAAYGGISQSQLHFEPMGFRV